MTRTRKALAVLVAGGLVLGGCGRPTTDGSATDHLVQEIDTQLVAHTQEEGEDEVAALSERDVDAVKKAVTTRIDKRLDALKRFGTTLAGAKRVQPAHRETLTKLLADQTTGLTELRAKVQSETSREALKADARSMVVDYRVFLLTGPKVRLTAAIDTGLAAAEKRNADAVTKSLTGQADKLLAIKPGPDGKAITAAVEPVRAAAKEARAALQAARK